MSFTNSFVNPVVRGVINPLKTITQKKELHFESRFRNNYGSLSDNPASFNYTLPNEIDDVVSLRLSSIHIPNAIYLISSASKNNIFYINEEDTPRTISSGNYSLANIHTAFETAIAIGGVSVTGDLNNDGKTIITNLSGNDITIHFYKQNECTNFMNTLGWILGFRTASVTIPNGSKATSSGIFDDGTTDYLYLEVDDFQRNVSNNNIVYLNKSTTNNNILGKVYKCPPDGTYKLNLCYDGYTNSEKTRRYYGPVRLSKFKFSLLDKFGNLVDLNNMDFSFTLEADVLYERDNVTIPC